MSKRGNTEGSIYQRKDGRWAASITLPDGKRKSYYGRTRLEASDKLKAVQKKVDDGLPLGSLRLRVDSWMETWLETARARVRPRTLTRYREIVKYHLIPRLGRKVLSQLTPAEVDRALLDALASGQSPRSVAHHRAVLRTALNAAMRDGHVGRNVASLASAPHVPEREYQPITQTQARAILEAMRGDRLEALFTVALACGLRQGEALALRWVDVDLEAASISVQRTLQRIEKEWKFMEPKTRSSRRTITVPGPVVKSLREHRARQAEERLRMGADWQGDQWGNLVFANKDGGPLSAFHVGRRFRALLRLEGLPRMRYHDLRHGAASLLAAMGVPPRVAMEMLGHADISTTMRIYAHIAPEYQKDAAQRISNVLWGEG